MVEGDRTEIENMGLERKRDGQQWMLDWMVKTTGRDRQFFYDNRTLPASVKSYAMIPREMEKQGRHKETLAMAAEEHRHFLTARELYQKAAVDYHTAHHAIAHDDDPEKIYLAGKVRECFDKVIQFSPIPMERVEIPFEGKSLPGVFYKAEQKSPCSTILFCNGMDKVKEIFPDPLNNPFTARGMNVLAWDGPGQGECNLRKIRITPDSWQRAGQVALDYLASRPEVDPERIGAIGFSMGSYWVMSLAARDPRLKAVASGAACYGPKKYIFETNSPHFKKVFMYMSGMHDEEAFDRMVNGMALTEEEISSIKAHCLMVVGEYDSMNPLDQALPIFEGLKVPKEYWLMENDDHTPFLYPHLGGFPAFHAMADWLLDALEGRKPADLNRKVVLHQDRGCGPYGLEAGGFYLPERLDVD